MPEKKVSKKKATKNEIETRISEIIKLILEGKSNHSIMLYSIQKYSIGKPQAYENIREAHKRLSQIYHTNIYSNYVRSLSLKFELFEKAMQEEDFDLASRILQHIDRQTGVEASALLISVNIEFAKLLMESVIKEFQIANESSDDKDRRYEQFLQGIERCVSQIFDQANPFAYQQKRLESGGESEPDEPVEKIIDCVL